MRKSQEYICAFCSRTKNQVEKLIIGKMVEPPIYMCNYCVEKSYERLAEISTEKKSPFKLLSPQKIYDELSKVVEGQEGAKKLLATASYNHYKRFAVSDNEVQIEKSNILMIGKSGSGKTLIAETLSKILKVPFASVDATTLTEVGFVGEDAEVGVKRLLKSANYDLEKTEMGIIFIDEIDKTRVSASHEVKDISGRGVQHALLKLIEDTTVEINYKKGGSGESIQVRTKNILFIFAGAFSDLPNLIKRDMRKKNNPLAIGEKSTLQALTSEDYSEIMKHMTHEHLEKYGIVPELLGRIPNRVILDELTEKDLINIMIRPKNAILKQYQKLLSINDNAKLEWTEEALAKIAKKAMVENTGARGIRFILEKILMDVMFTIPSLNRSVKVIIDEKTVETNHPLLEFEDVIALKSDVEA